MKLCKDCNWLIEGKYGSVECGNPINTSADYVNGGVRYRISPQDLRSHEPNNVMDYCGEDAKHFEVKDNGQG
jgi:hypothetical protein